MLNVLFSHMSWFYQLSCFCSFSSLLQTSQGCAFWETRCVSGIKAGNYKGLLALFSAVFAQQSMWKNLFCNYPSSQIQTEQKISLQALGLGLFRMSGLQSTALWHRAKRSGVQNAQCSKGVCASFHLPGTTQEAASCFLFPAASQATELQVGKEGRTPWCGPTECLCWEFLTSRRMIRCISWWDSKEKMLVLV